MAIIDEMGAEYGFSFEKYVYQEEIEKIPEEERAKFEQNFLQDFVYNAQIRILAWLYHEYFGEWYQFKESRIRTGKRMYAVQVSGPDGDVVENWELTDDVVTKNRDIKGKLHGLRYYENGK